MSQVIQLIKEFSLSINSLRDLSLIFNIGLLGFPFGDDFPDQYLSNYSKQIRTLMDLVKVDPNSLSVDPAIHEIQSLTPHKYNIYELFNRPDVTQFTTIFAILEFDLFKQSTFTQTIPVFLCKTPTQLTKKTLLSFIKQMPDILQQNGVLFTIQQDTKHDFIPFLESLFQEKTQTESSQYISDFFLRVIYDIYERGHQMMSTDFKTLNINDQIAYQFYKLFNCNLSDLTQKIMMD